jgi:RNA polymerase sigma-70 factor (ECF subfamily)
MTEADFRDAYRQNKDSLYRFACRMTQSATAEDIVQECFMALWKNSSLFQRNRGSMRIFLFGITRNLALQRLRRERPYDPLEEESSIVAPLDPETGERADMVARAIAALPPLQREALILAEYEELSLEEIARITEAEHAAVKSRLHRARENLRRLLAPLLESKDKAYGTRE